MTLLSVWQSETLIKGWISKRFLYPPPALSPILFVYQIWVVDLPLLRRQLDIFISSIFPDHGTKILVSSIFIFQKHLSRAIILRNHCS